MSTAKIGMLCWESGTVPKGLLQLEALTGNSTNPDTFDFKIEYRRIPGANTQTVLLDPEQRICDAMIQACHELSSSGVKAITTSCGFNAIFQKQITQEVEVPVFTSALMHIPMLQIMLAEKSIAILTANSEALTTGHLNAVGINDQQNLHIYGLQKYPHWQAIFNEPDNSTNMDSVAKEILTEVDYLMADCSPSALVLECTDLPPFADAIRQQFKIPVFDIVTLTNYVYASL